MSKTQARWISFSGRTLAAVALIATGGFVLHAQSTQARGTAPTASAQEPILNLQTADSGQAYSSSDAEQAGTEIAANTTNPFESLNAMQYGGGRQRYGRPRYRGGNTNADGSPKYDFYVGGGFGIPVGDQSNYLTTGWGFQGGGGRMFNKMVGVNLEFSYDHFGMTGATVDQQSVFYFGPGNTAAVTGLGGNTHVWSFSLQPVVNLRSGEGLGAYVTGGVGFYHKVANFTLPQEEEYCDPYYGCEEYEAPANVDHYSSNAPGFDGGFGVTYKFSRFASERLYAEVRYTYVANQFKPGITTATALTYTGNNYFPQNSQHTSYIPVKFGLRF
jgi:hypothetical protein